MVANRRANVFRDEGEFRGLTNEKSLCGNNESLAAILASAGESHFSRDRIMRTALVGVLVLCLIAIVSSQDAPQPQQRITVNELIATEVVSHLGVPMGECVRIRATITGAGRNKADSGSYKLTITQVNGVPLEPAVVSRFDVHPFATKNVRLANDSFSLHELRTGNKAKSISSTQMKKLEEGYLGSSVDLLAYETGTYEGIPTNLPADMVTWQGSGFQFMTKIVVIDRFR